MKDDETGPPAIASLKAFLLLYGSLPKRPLFIPGPEQAAKFRELAWLESSRGWAAEEEIVNTGSMMSALASFAGPGGVDVDSVSMGTCVPHTICVKCDFHTLEPKTKLRGYTKYAAILDYPAFFPATLSEDDTCSPVGINLVERLDDND